MSDEFSGWWEAVGPITSPQADFIKEAVREAEAAGKTLIVTQGVTLVRHVAPDSLDAAWAEAEAVLPEGVGLLVATMAGDSWARTLRGNGEEGDGPTPAAALRALAAKLREAGR